MAFPERHSDSLFGKYHGRYISTPRKYSTCVYRISELQRYEVSVGHTQRRKASESCLMRQAPKEGEEGEGKDKRQKKAKASVRGGHRLISLRDCLSAAQGENWKWIPLRCAPPPQFLASCICLVAACMHPLHHVQHMARRAAQSSRRHFQFTS